MDLSKRNCDTHRGRAGGMEGRGSQIWTQEELLVGKCESPNTHTSFSFSLSNSAIL